MRLERDRAFSLQLFSRWRLWDALCRATRSLEELRERAKRVELGCSHGGISRRHVPFENTGAQNYRRCIFVLWMAAMLQLRGATQKTLEQYQQALALRPADATVENALGGALLASHQIPEAIAHLTAAVNARPEYSDAHYNLGIAQTTAGNFPAAVQELATAVKLKPDDAGAEASLGAAYGELGETQKAITHLNRALQLDPGNALAKENLEALRGTSAQP